MKKILLPLIIAMFCIASPVLNRHAAATEDAEPSTDTVVSNYSYCIGVDIGGSLRHNNVELDMDSFVRGFTDAFEGSELAFSHEEIQEILGAFQQRMRAQHAQQGAIQMEKNLREGAAFLAENKKRDGVKTTESGLQYEVLTMGDGEKPEETSTVTVHYRGTLIDGQEFDSSYRHNRPARFVLNEVIDGWTEGLQLMPTGSKFKFFLPSELAYGDQQIGPLVTPGSTLVFEVELLEFE